MFIVQFVYFLNFFRSFIVSYVEIIFLFQHKLPFFVYVVMFFIYNNVNLQTRCAVFLYKKLRFWQYFVVLLVLRTQNPLDVLTSFIELFMWQTYIYIGALLSLDRMPSPTFVIQLRLSAGDDVFSGVLSFVGYLLQILQ